MRAIQAVPVDNVPYEKKKFDYRVDNAVCRSNAFLRQALGRELSQNEQQFNKVASRVWLYIVNFNGFSALNIAGRYIHDVTLGVSLLFSK